MVSFVMIVSVTKPKSRPAQMLTELGIQITPVPEDEGNVDRYILSERLAIERRAGSSLLRGIVDKTLFTSAIYLREHFEVPILIVEGEVNYGYMSFDPQAVRGALSSVMLVYGLSVLTLPDVKETVALIAMMCRQEQVGVPEISLVPKRKATDLADLQRRVVEMLPGCGRVAARDLLQHLGSVRRIAMSSPEELRDVRGIGAKKATAIYEVLNAEYEAVDTERDLEEAIEVQPGLLFDHPIVLLARQHHVYTGASERYIVDLVFLDERSQELILVELKRGRLAVEHETQLCRYLDHAGESELLRTCIDAGARVRGILATITEGAYTPQDPRIAVRIVDEARAIQVLKRLRSERLDCAVGSSLTAQPR
jgi:ERCC4-type nuclease